MTLWSDTEEERLSAMVLERFYRELKPLDGKNILVLCSCEGDVVFWLMDRAENFNGKIVGLERDKKSLRKSKERLKHTEWKEDITFDRAERQTIPYPDNSFDAVLSEFIIFPTPKPTEISQSEMARVLKPGGKILLTDVIMTEDLPDAVRNEFQSLGLEYLCDATKDDFRQWMREAGLNNITIEDLTPKIREIWEHRSHRGDKKGYQYLLRGEYALGNPLFYIYAHGEK